MVSMGGEGSSHGRSIVTVRQPTYGNFEMEERERQNLSTRVGYGHPDAEMVRVRYPLASTVQSHRPTLPPRHR
jgi:hypothetical protein